MPTSCTLRKTRVGWESVKMKLEGDFIGNLGKTGLTPQAVILAKGSNL